MFVMRQTHYAKWAFAFLLLVLISNLLVYRSPISSTVIPEDSFWLVAGSLVYFGLVVPLLVLLSFRINAKQLLAVIAAGLIAARFIIPALYFEPFAPIFYIGLAIEMLVLAAELALLGLLLIHISKIRRSMLKQSGSPLFALFPAVHENVKPNPLIHIVLSEALAFYYAFCTWKNSLQKTQHPSLSIKTLAPSHLTSCSSTPSSLRPSASIGGSTINPLYFLSSCSS